MPLIPAAVLRETLEAIRQAEGADSWTEIIAHMHFYPDLHGSLCASDQGPSSLTRRTVQVTALPLQTHACVDPLWGSLSSVLLSKYTSFYSCTSRIRLCTISHANMRSLWRQSLFRPDISSMVSTTRDTPFAHCIYPVHKLRTWRSCACLRIHATCL